MTTIAVVDYGMGNLRSVAKALEHVAPRAPVTVTGPTAKPTAPTLQPASALEVWRRKLLDLTRRNRLLDFKATRRTTIRVVGESPTELLRLLALEGRALVFLPGTKPLRRPPNTSSSQLASSPAWKLLAALAPADLARCA